MKLNTKPKALLIDLDGTLIDTIPMLYEAYVGFLRHYGVLGTPKEFQSLMGPSLSEIIVILQERYHINEERSILLDVYQQGLVEAYEQRVVFFPYALETMRYAQKQHIKLALVTSSEKHFIKAFVKGAGLNSLFDAVVYPQDGVRSKPFPDLFLNALKSLKLTASEVLAIEDSINGVQAATSAEIPTLWIKHNTFFKSTSSENDPLILNSFKNKYCQVDDWKAILTKLMDLCDE